jgi:hypothetical protein
LVLIFTVLLLSETAEFSLERKSRFGLLKKWPLREKQAAGFTKVFSKRVDEVLRAPQGLTSLNVALDFHGDPPFSDSSFCGGKNSDMGCQIEPTYAVSSGDKLPAASAIRNLAYRRTLYFCL